MSDMTPRYALALTDEARREHLGDLGPQLRAQSKLWNHATGLVALLHQYDLDYGQDERLLGELEKFADRIEADAAAKMEVADE